MGDGGQLGKIRDLGPSALDATMHSFAANPRVASHHGGMALNFGAAPWAQASYDANTNCTKGLTLAAWVFRVNANDRIVFGKPFNTTDTTPFWDFCLRYLGGSGITLRIGSLANSFNGGSTNVWEHWAVTADGANHKWYLNGKLVKTVATAVLPTNTNSQGVLIGSNASQLELWSGRQEGLRIYNRALNDSEIARLFAEPYAGMTRRRFFVGSAGGNVPTNITLAQASWVWAGQAITIDAKTMITLAQGAWTWTGRAASLNAKNMITLAQGVWRWTGIPIGGLVNDLTNYLLGLLGVGL